MCTHAGTAWSIFLTKEHTHLNLLVFICYEEAMDLRPLVLKMSSCGNSIKWDINKTHSRITRKKKFKLIIIQGTHNPNHDNEYTDLL